MSEKLKKLKKEIEDSVKAVNKFWDEAGDENLPKDKREEVKTLNKKLEDSELEFAELKEQEDMKSAARLRGRLPFPVADDGDKGGDPNPSDRFREAKSLGERFVGSDEVKAWLSGIMVNGHVPAKQHLQSPAVNMKTVLSAKGLLTGASRTSAGALVNLDYKPLVDAAPFRPLTIRDLLTNGETSSDTVEYPQIVGYTNNAGMVPEAQYSGAIGTGNPVITTVTGGVKPESAMQLVKVDAQVKTVAHFMPVTTRALQDAPQIRTLIDGFLEFGLEQKLEDQIIAGDGTGENFLGILNTGGIQTQTFVTDILKTTRKARTKLKTPGRVTPSAYVMNPLDWETIDLSQNEQGMYYFGGPQVMGNPRLWGVPVVESEAVPPGTAILADWHYAVLWDRMQAAITMSNSHADFFIRNLVAILAELRAAFGVTYTKAFCTIAFA